MRPSTLTVLRDLVVWVIAGMILLKQAGILFDPPSQVNETLVWVAAALTGGPGVAQLIAARFGPSTSTAEPSSHSPPSELPPSSPGAS